MENKNNKVNKKRLAISILILIAFIALIVGLYFGLGLHGELTDSDALKDRILAYGNKGKFIYVLLNFLQTTILPITNIPTIMAGVYIFGPIEAATLAIIGVLSGSVLSFYFGRYFGRKTIEWIISKEQVEKYLEMAKGRESVVIFLILLLPGFPDDIICMIAGLTSMRWRTFFITILITRTIPIYLITYSSNLIPFNTWWGLLIWAFIYIVVILAGRYVIKNWNKITNYFDKFDKTKKEDN